jgi:hypothetical protein
MAFIWKRKEEKQTNNFLAIEVPRKQLIVAHVRRICLPSNMESCTVPTGFHAHFSQPMVENPAPY